MNLIRISVLVQRILWWIRSMTTMIVEYDYTILVAMDLTVAIEIHRLDWRL